MESKHRPSTRKVMQHLFQKSFQGCDASNRFGLSQRKWPICKPLLRVAQFGLLAAWSLLLMTLRCRFVVYRLQELGDSNSSMNLIRPLRSCTSTGLVWKALCGMWHTVLELMFRSVQLHSTQLSLTATFQSCGLWHLMECCSQYIIQRCAANDTAFRSISSKMSFKSFESGMGKKRVRRC